MPYCGIVVVVAEKLETLPKLLTVPVVYDGP
jgi:hypothetical protein